MIKGSSINSFKGIRSENGHIMIITFAVLATVLFIVLFLVAGSQIYYTNTTYSTNAEQAVALAEAGIDKAVAALNKTGGSYSGETETFLGDGSYSVVMTSKDAGTKIIESTGYIPNKENPKAKRTIKIESSRGVGVAFTYGIQVGEGGMELGNGNTIKGSVYSNGNIVAGNSNVIVGDAWVAGGPQAVADQSADCVDNSCTDFLFGKNIGGQDRLDIAQSFQPAQSGVLNKISVRIKKFNNPPDLTVRILRDDNGKPDKNGVLTSGILYSNLVTSQYGWIEVAFSSLPVLTQDTTYWLLIDTTSDSSNYWSWQNNLAQSYTRGVPKWAPKWDHGSPSWNSFSGDLGFNTYMGGIPTSIRGGSNKMEIEGNVHANTIENLDIGKDAYYQTKINSTVDGTIHPNSADPPPKVFPISDANVTDWKKAVDKPELTQTGDITSCVATLGPAKIVGNVNFNSGCKITVKTPIWITGTLTLNSNNTLTLDNSYGQSSGVIIVDGKVVLNTNNHLNGTGNGSSLLMVLTNFDSRGNNEDAIAVNSNGNTGVYYAGVGSINPGTGNSFKELTAWKIKLINQSTIDYETGLSSTLFTSGPSGTYSLVKGTYQIK